MKNTNYLVDTSAIVELVKGSDKGMAMLNLIERNENNLNISTLTIYELGTVLERKYGSETMEEILRSIMNYFHVMDVTPPISFRAIELKRKFKLPTVDCLIYASAKEIDAVVVSGCKHFREISDEQDVMIV